MTDPDVIVVGAGLAGLTCARQIQQAGHSVLVVEKARGVGGRATTRRLSQTCVDRGLPFLSVQGEYTRQLVAALQASERLQPWPTRAGQMTATGSQAQSQISGYTLTAGVSAIAKHLAHDLTVHCQYRLQSLQRQDQGWQLQPETATEPDLQASAVVLALPAPQARALLAPLDPRQLPPLAHTLGVLAAVEFAPCIAMAVGYPVGSLDALPGDWLEFPDDGAIAHLSLESSKRAATEAVLVVYSTPEFANAYLDAADLQAATAALLARLAVYLELPTAPLWTLPHRWRYANTQRPARQPYLTASESPPLLCCGDWCLGDRAESALASGAAAATALLQFGQAER
ncbi:MAG: FAD-dependent oxidoreductase [Spirulinaceae cyanobacterium SM2_1_0]|nr:FAD-dependent oxidoreductase [Spirulinaceae cyanobacterium SM2_1_0]